MHELNVVNVTGNKPSILQLSYGIEKANTFIIEDSGHALVIDACSEKVSEELKKRNIVPDYLILTHEHCDHLWGVNAIRAKYSEVQVIAQKYCSEAIGDSKRNKAKQYHIYAALRFGEHYYNKEAKNREFTCGSAELVFEDKYELNWHGWDITGFHAPGHSPGSILISVNGVGVFSGDSILREETYLKFDGGDEKAFINITLPIIHEIPQDTTIFPGHGDFFQMGEWREYGRTS